ncbi:substrate-binding and VWA domain-containing protein [Dactylosporangium sp. AC04546]|uniref:substrate-binding and VWA domain-containing protein n=1 Tax=Dactylosporangium sp. AC04546 TaxID=2862460 RepID=UPI001EDF14D0|nr:substrate-binding and VWA domain-containing protein [Dactylosporangium sp. AC04546]WVK78204.1 substrate-binding and VWA domain-containing protein [Dactylosporangium sp. AC04546]
MAYTAERADVRSHRRSPAQRRFRFTPWIIGGLVVVLAGAGGFIAWNKLVANACSGDVTATIVASPSTATLLEGLAAKWEATDPAVAGQCAHVAVTARETAVMAQALGTEWDNKTGTPPDVWVPDSTAWVRRASTAAIAERMMPDLQPSLARTPSVLAMPKPMAEALGWPGGELSWQDLINTVAADPAGWSKYQKPDWGAFKFGMTDPLQSTSGLLALMAILDGNDDGEVTPEEQATLAKLKQQRAVYTNTTAQLLDGLSKADKQGGALQYVSAFPALEQDVLTYNKANPKVPLVAVYPSNGSADADNPYLVLEAPWAQKDKQDVAKAFLTYLRGPDGRKVFLDAGFRDPNRAAGAPLTGNAAFSAKIKTVPRAVLLPESVKQSMDSWTALTRPTNVLLVLDVSGSMAEQVPGTGKTRMQLAKEAARGAVQLFDGEVDAGLWVFSTKQNGVQDYKQLIPIGRIADQVAGKPRRDQMVAAIDKLTPIGDTGLYDTAAAAQQAVVDAYKPGATNLVVLMTDGKNDDSTGGLTLDALRTKLQANAGSEKKVPVVTVGYGNDADFAALQEISRVSGGTLYTSKTAFDINEVLMTAIFGKV